MGFPAVWSVKYGQPIVPLDYMLPNIKMGMRALRTQIIKPCDTQMPLQSSDTPDIIWKVPSTQRAFLDFRRAAIKLNFSVGGGGASGTTYAASNLAWNMFERIQMIQGGKVVEDRRYYGQQETFMFTLGAKWGCMNTVAPQMWGYGPQYLRASHASNFTVLLPWSFESMTKGVMPWFKTDASGVILGAPPEVELTWTLSPANRWVEAIGTDTSVTYTINKFEIIYEELGFETTWSGFLQEWKSFASKAPQVLFQTITTRVYDLTTATEQLIQIDHRAQSIIGVFATFRYSTSVQNPLVYDKFETWLGPSTIGLQYYQWEINNTDWPQQRINIQDTDAVEAARHLLMSMELYHSRGVMDEVWTISPVDFVTDSFVCTLDAKVHPFNNHLLNPVSTAGSNTNIVLKMWFNSVSGAAANLQVVTHVVYHSMWNYGNVSGNILEY